jgi:uncharacterized protein YfcZ (UPF0381/DUF406 family)
LQTELARASAILNAQKETDNLYADQFRLSQAEDSVISMLKRIDSESREVEKAVEDLRAAQAELDKDFLFKLKEGGVVKQSALVGFLLFSIRSIIESLAALGDESHLAPALIQGGIAIVCAVYFFFV